MSDPRCRTYGLLLQERVPTDIQPVDRQTLDSGCSPVGLPNAQGR